MLTHALAATAALTLALAPADGWLDSLKDAAREKRDQLIRRSTDEAGDAAAGKAKDAASGQGKKGKKGEKGAEPQERTTAGQSEDAAAGEAGEGGKPEAAPAEETAAVYGNEFDYVPGDKVLFFDDFSETDVGDYPTRWTMKDGGGGAPATVVEQKGRRLFRATPPPDAMSDSVHWIRMDLGDRDLPQKFTVEADVDLAGGFSFLFSDQANYSGQEVTLQPDGEVRSANAQAQLKPWGAGLKRVSISVNGTYLKVYVGGKRVLVDSDGVERPVRRLGIRFHASWTSDEKELAHQAPHLLFTSYRLAEGGKDYAKELTRVGKIVTHGITFDTGADVIKPESGPALRGILKLLQDQPALRFEIGGHTDDQGSEKVNGPLSERRAAAVKAWLVSQGVDAKRLTVKGYGASKPLEPNATAEGRAMNRRVEFVKLGNS